MPGEDQSSNLRQLELGITVWKQKINFSRQKILFPQDKGSKKESKAEKLTLANDNEVPESSTIPKSLDPRLS